MTVRERSRPLNVAIDARYLSHNLIGGVRTYVESLSLALLRIEGDLKFHFWIDNKATFELDNLPSEVGVYRLGWRSGASSVRNDLRIGRAMQRSGADVAHFPANHGLAPTGLPRVVTIHDAINLLPMKEIVEGHSRRPKVVGTMAYLHHMTRRSVRQQPDVVTVSDYSRREILKHADLDPARVHVVPSAHDAMFAPAASNATEGMRKQLRLRGRVILADAIKNPECVLRAYRALPDPVRLDTSLVFFSRRAAPEPVQESSRNGECTVLIQPSREELVVLFTLADLFIFPSWYEGFGLPVLEAMACGTPVIASDRGSLPEVLGSAGFVVDAEDHLAVAYHASDLLSDHYLHVHHSELAMLRAEAFSWAGAATRMYEIYNEVYQRSHVAQTWQVSSTKARTTP